MIGRKNLHVTAERANFPLGALNVRAGSAANVALFDVPVRAGVSVTAVWMRVTNCDGESDDFAAVQTGTLWVVDVPAAHFATPGDVPNGVEVWASGTGADGDPHTWSIGVGDLCVLDGDSGEPVPGVAWTAIKLRETAPTNPAYGDAKIESGALYVWDGSQWAGGGGGGGGIVDDTVTRASSNAVKSSGIWSAIWGALTALPTGFTALYDWVVDQLTGKADKSEMSVTTANDTATITLKQGTSATVITQHQPLPAAVAPSTSAVQGAYADARDTGTALAGKQTSITASGILKGNGAGGVTAAVAGTDYQAPLTIDATPTANSTNPVQSGGVKTALDDKLDESDVVDPMGQTAPTAGQAADALEVRGAFMNVRDSLDYIQDYGVRYAIGTELTPSGGVYALEDRTANLIVLTSGTTFTVSLPDPLTEHAVVRDLILDVDNFANSSDVALEFDALGGDYALTTVDGDDIAEITTVEAGGHARFLITETAFKSAYLPVFSIQRIALGAFTTSITRGS